MKRRFLFIFLAFIIFLIDQFSKAGIKGSLYFGSRITLIPGLLNLTYVENRGGAFGIFATVGSPYKAIIFSAFSLAAIGIILYYLIKLPLENNLLSLGLALILSGAIGNFLDRVRLGYVIDFIDLHIKGYHWPTFNLADTAICIGLGIIGISYIFSSPKKSSSVKKELSDAS